MGSVLLCTALAHDERQAREMSSTLGVVRDTINRIPRKVRPWFRGGLLLGGSCLQAVGVTGSGLYWVAGIVLCSLTFVGVSDSI